MSERDYSGAIALWRQVVTMRPGSASTHLRLADALLAANRLDEAASAYQTAISLDEAPAEPYRRLAEVYEAVGRREDSAAARARYVSRKLEELTRRGFLQ